MLMRRVPAMVLVLVVCQGAAAAVPLMHFDFSRMDATGAVPNLGGCSTYRLQVTGKRGVTREGALQLDGVTTRMEITGSEDFDLEGGATFCLVYRPLELPDNDDANRSMDCFFSKPREFVFSRHRRHIYGNLHDGSKWSASRMVIYQFKPGDTYYHHLVMTIHRHQNPNDAEDWVERTFYLDGMRVGIDRRPKLSLLRRKGRLEVGCCSCMGSTWMLGGEVADVRIYDRVLTEAQVRRLVLSQPLVSPGFRELPRLDAAAEASIASLSVSPALRSAIRNHARSPRAYPAWRDVLRDPERYLVELAGPRTSLVIFRVSGGYAHISSWYDRETGRELFAPSNRLVSWIFAEKGRQHRLDPFSRGVRSRLSSPPVEQDGVWRFRVEYRHSPDVTMPFAMEAASDFVFGNDRLSFRHRAASRTAGVLLHSVEQPSLALCSLERGKDMLLVPNGCGVEMPDPIGLGVDWSQPYPRAFATMQMLAYYDRRQGMAVIMEDPLARPKRLAAKAADEALDLGFTWRVPYEAAERPNEFQPSCAASVVLTGGSWYDVGLAYREALSRFRAPWFPSTPPPEQPSYFQENCYWVQGYYYGKYLDDLVEVRDYMGLDTIQVDIWNWWERGVESHLAPHMRATPDFIEYTRYMSRHGVRPIPYTNGRLWAAIDRRGEDYQYTVCGAKAAVISDGRRMREEYAVPCDILCPATGIYQETFAELFRRLTEQGVPGIYIDQLGAGYQPPCHAAKEHGHDYADWNAWYLNGHARMLKNVRRHWRETGQPHFLTTEDNAEQLVGMLDGFQSYRWSTDGQVPLFPMVYAGKVQFYNRTAATPDASYQTVAEQLLNGEQLGHFTFRDMAFPYNHPFRDYAKQMIWLRHVLLPVFNRGEMARPPVLRDPVPRNKCLWSTFGSRFVTKPALQTGAWSLNGTLYTIVINTGREKLENAVRITGHAGEHFEIWRSRGTRCVGQLSGSPAQVCFTLAPRDFLLIANSREDCRDKNMTARLEHDFGVITGVPDEHPVFMPIRVYPQNGRDPRVFMNLVDSPIIIGGNRDRKRRLVNYNAGTYIDAGSFDFGRRSPACIQLEVAYNKSREGAVHVYQDEVVPENRVAVFRLAENTGTGGPETFKVLTSAFEKKLVGVRRLLFTASGGFPYSLRSWRVQD